MRSKLEGKTKKIKLVQIIADSEIGGGPAHILGLLENLDKKLFELSLICPHGYLEKEAKKIKGVAVFCVEMDSKFNFQAKREIKDILSQIQSKNDPFGPMIVHMHGPRAVLLSDKAIPSIARRVYSEHIWSAEYQLENRINHYIQQRILARINNRNDLIIAVSTPVKKFLIEKRMAPENRVIVIPNGITINNQKPKINNQKKRNNYIIGAVGSLNIQKGFEYLIEAMAEIIKVYPHAMLEIVGDGEEEQNLKLKTQNQKLEKNITFLGKKENIEKYYQHWDVFVSSSISETFGIVVLEAMAAGLPVVATHVGGVVDLVKNKNSGLLVEPSSPDQIAKAVIEIFSHPAITPKYIREGKKTAQNYDWKVVIKKIEVQYLKLVKNA